MVKVKVRVGVRVRVKVRVRVRVSEHVDEAAQAEQRCVVRPREVGAGVAIEDERPRLAGQPCKVL